MIRITAKQDGFRRCGVAHTTAGKEWPDDAWNKEQLARLEADPMLVVQRTVDAKAGAEPSASKPTTQNAKPAAQKATKGNTAKPKGKAGTSQPTVSESGEGKDDDATPEQDGESAAKEQGAESESKAEASEGNAE